MLTRGKALLEEKSLTNFSFPIRFIEIVSSFNPLFSDHNHQPAQKTAHCRMDVFHPPGVKNEHRKNITRKQSELPAFYTTTRIANVDHYNCRTFMTSVIAFAALLP